MKKLLLYVVYFFVSSASAQIISSGLDAQSNVDALGRDNINGMVRKFDARYEGIRGTPFLFNYWNNGTILLKNGKSFANVPVKIDLYGNEVISKRASGDSLIVQSNTIDKVTLTDVLSGKTYTLKKWADLGTAKTGYAEVLHEGKYTLLAERKKILIKANYQGAYSANRPFDEFVNEVGYYIKKGNQSPEKVKLSRKLMLELLADHQPEVKSFINKEQIDFREENQVVKLFQYYEGLK